MSTIDEAKKLSRRIFGNKELRSHFSIERWGGCHPELIDSIEAAGRAGLNEFGYENWRILASRQQAARGQNSYRPNGCSVGVDQVQVPGVSANKKFR